MKTQNNFRVVKVTTPNQLEEIVLAEIQAKNVSYYLFVNTWDKVCQNFNTHLGTLNDLGSPEILYVIDVFDIPNALNVLKSAVYSFKEYIPANSLNNYTKLPMMVKLNGAFPIVIDYNGNIAASIGY